MSSDKPKLSGPDLTQAVELSTIPDGTMLLGHAQGEPVLLARRGDEVFAIGAICTHYGAPLSRGSSSGIPFDAPGITPVSTCALARLSAPRHWTRSPAGVSKPCATWRVSSHQSMSRSVRIRPGEAGALGAAATASSGRHAAIRHHRRWRCSRKCRRRSASSRRLYRPPYDAER